jgi:hypothetical protein
VPATTSSAMTRWIVIFATASTGAVAGVLFLIWAMNGFVSLASLGLSGNILVALILGIVLSTGLGVGLMGLVFYSDRSDQDEAVYHASGSGTREGNAAQHGPKPDLRSNPN